MRDFGPVYILMAFFALIVSYLMGGFTMESQWQKRAVKAGVAEWISGADGNAEFKFKTK
jgi:hypothetical protein